MEKQTEFVLNLIYQGNIFHFFSLKCSFNIYFISDISNKNEILVLLLLDNNNNPASVFSVTWSFRIPSNMLICCSRKIIFQFFISMDFTFYNMLLNIVVETVMHLF